MRSFSIMKFRYCLSCWWLKFPFRDISQMYMGSRVNATMEAMISSLSRLPELKTSFAVSFTGFTSRFGGVWFVVWSVIL